MTGTQSLDASAYFDQRRNMHRRLWEAALPYAEFVATGDSEDQKAWQAVFDRVGPTPHQGEFLKAFTRQMKILVVAATWSRDCVRQVPMLERLAAASPVVHVKVLDRDAHPDVRDEVRLCGAARVPVAIFLTEDYFECSRMGDRTLSTYRTLAKALIGPTCPVGDPLLKEDEIAATQQDWLNEFERVQLMMRLSPYLRERYGD